MRIGRVVGNVVSTVNTPSHEGFRIMVVVPINMDGKRNGDTYLALDCSQAGIGDYVLTLMEGSSASQVMGRPRAAVNSVIVGVIDFVEDSTGKRIVWA